MDHLSMAGICALQAQLFFSELRGNDGNNGNGKGCIRGQSSFA